MKRINLKTPPEKNLPPQRTQPNEVSESRIWTYFPKYLISLTLFVHLEDTKAFKSCFASSSLFFFYFPLSAALKTLVKNNVHCQKTILYLAVTYTNLN
jgi:hypothetical protein